MYTVVNLAYVKCTQRR